MSVTLDYSNHVFSTRDRLEKYAQVVTGSHTINNIYGTYLRKSLRYRHITGFAMEKFNAHEIYPNLYVGDVYAANNITELKKRGFTHIVNCVPSVHPAFPGEFKYLYIPILDCPSETIIEQFQSSFSFIHDALSNHGRVLIHCIKGMSRSATIASAYIMKAFHISPREAVNIIQARRGVVRPNYGFMIQLELFAKQIQEEQYEEQIASHQSDPAAASLSSSSSSLSPSSSSSSSSSPSPLSLSSPSSSEDKCPEPVRRASI